MGTTASERNNLSRDEAARRSALVSTSAYRVDLDLTDRITGAPGEKIFRSRSEITFTCSEPGASTFVEVVANAVDVVELNGVSLPPADVVDGLRIRLDDLAAENVLVVEADCLYTRTGEGLHRFVDRVDDAVYLYSQFETADAKRMYACFDQPDLKASFDFTVLAPVGWKVVMNSPASAIEPAGPAVKHVFTTTEPMSPYVTALVAGPYHEVRRTHDGIDMGLFCRASLAVHLDPDELFEVTAQGFDFYHREFDFRYPFGDKYDQLFVPEFNAGAMENAGCVTILEDYVFRSRTTDAAYERRAETVLHELAHMWFGDLVTMRWWDDLWLNESFATFASVLCQAESTRWPNAWATFATTEKTWAYRQDQLPSTHPIAADMVDIEAVEVNFDGITYAKGASVLKQLFFYVGRDAFFTALRAYFKAHAYGNSTLADLLGQLEKASGRDLGTWSKQWLQTAGVNTLRPDFDVADDGTYSRFEIVQTAPDEHPTLREQRLAVGLYSLTDDGLIRTGRFELDVAGATTEVPELVGQSQPDLLLLNDEDLGYAKTRLDARSLATLATSMASLQDPVARAMCWAATWEMVRDAEMPSGQYLDQVLGGVGAETDINTVQSLLRLSMSAATLYGDPGHRDERLARIADTAWSLAQQAEPGSDHQLAFVRGWVVSASGDAGVERLQALLSGSTTLDGLALDADLRWTLLLRLSALGVVGEAEIDAEAERDATSAGERQAAACRAALPDAEHKRRAWDSVVERDELANAVQGAVIAGFTHWQHVELTRPYVTPYLEAVDRIWQERTSEMAQQIIIGLFPTLHPDALAEVDAWLAANADAPPALRRMLIEGRDGLARTARCRAADV